MNESQNTSTLTLPLRHLTLEARDRPDSHGATVCFWTSNVTWKHSTEPFASCCTVLSNYNVSFTKSIKFWKGDIYIKTWDVCQPPLERHVVRSTWTIELNKYDPKVQLTSSRPMRCLVIVWTYFLCLRDINLWTININGVYLMGT